MSKKNNDESVLVTKIITKSDQTSSLQIRRASLKITKGPDKGLQIKIQGNGVVVGSAPECDLVVTDPAVSRRHFELVPVERGFLLRDLGSKNGTGIGNIAIKEAILTGQAEIIIGQSRIRFSILSEHDEFPLSSRSSLGRLLGRSVAMRKIFYLLERAAKSDTTLLLEGESGTGKDLAAETVHELSDRRRGPFLVVDCGAVKSTLVESELFGHRKGAFTGAEKDRAGVFESATKGTVFLDEIGELDPALQPKLLRLLENRQIKRLGENKYRPVDVRLIAATNRDLKAEVDSGKFRQDLYYRISVLGINMVPLRDRREDIGMLARSFVQKLDQNVDPLKVVSDQVISMFLNHDWPGNVRELRNVVERLLLFPEKPAQVLQLTKADQNQAITYDNLINLPFHDARRNWIDRFEKVYLTSLLDANQGVVARAARQAGIPRQTFHRLLTKHGLGK
jgi:transcriptional regulator with GAF, ATPase, and Fis domain